MTPDQNLKLVQTKQFSQPLAEIESDLLNVLREQADYFDANKLYVWVRIGRHANPQDCQRLHQDLQQLGLASCDARQDLQLEGHEVHIYTQQHKFFDFFGLFRGRSSAARTAAMFTPPTLDAQSAAPSPQSQQQPDAAAPAQPQYQASAHVLDPTLEQLIFVELSRLIQDLKALNSQLQHHPQHNIGIVHSVIFQSVDAHRAQVQRFFKILENPINRRVLIERLVAQIDGQMVGYVDARHVAFQQSTSTPTADQLAPSLDAVGQQPSMSVQLDYCIEMRTPPQPTPPHSGQRTAALPCPLGLVVKDQRYRGETPISLNISHQPFVIGRDPAADYTTVVDKSAPVSRRHVEFFVQDQAWWCRNIGSNPILVGENTVLKPTEQLLLVNKMSLCLGTAKVENLGKYAQYPVLEVMLQHASLSVEPTPINNDAVAPTAPHQVEPTVFDDSHTAATASNIQAVCVFEQQETLIAQLPFLIGRSATGLRIGSKYTMVSNQHFEVVAISSQGVTVKLCAGQKNPSFFTDPLRTQTFVIKPDEAVLIEFGALLIVNPSGAATIDADSACILSFQRKESM